MSSAAPPLPEFAARLGDRRLFPDLAAWAYLNHAAISPLSRLARAAMGRAIGDVSREGVGAVGPWMAQRARLRAALAGFLDCEPEALALTTNTGAGIRAVALGFPWAAGDRVLLFEGEFPANITPWQQAAALFELELRFASLAPFAAPGGADLGEVEAALQAGVRLVAVSAVQFRSGLRMPIEALGELCRRYGAALCVDAAQGVGLTPLLAGSADFIAAPGHKWLMGPEGTGFLVIHRDQRLRP
ncbi:MAG: aminotransferase class V-fold PLP-dependent enzyme, partial [Myxococcales bacterium]|nr:aminotransferase class V-fold PLP-dependent enzyme [Myxococcales bacterium]